MNKTVQFSTRTLYCTSLQTLLLHDKQRIVSETRQRIPKIAPGMSIYLLLCCILIYYFEFHTLSGFIRLVYCTSGVNMIKFSTKLIGRNGHSVFTSFLAKVSDKKVNFNL